MTPPLSGTIEVFWIATEAVRPGRPDGHVRGKGGGNVNVRLAHAGVTATTNIVTVVAMPAITP